MTNNDNFEKAIENVLKFYNQKENKTIFKKLEKLYKNNEQKNYQILNSILNETFKYDHSLWQNVEKTSRTFSAFTALIYDCKFMKRCFEENVLKILLFNAKYLKNKCSYKYFASNHCSGEEYSNAYKAAKLILQCISIFKVTIRTDIDNEDACLSTTISDVANSCIISLQNEKITDLPYLQMCGVICGHIINFSEEAYIGKNLMQLFRLGNNSTCIKITNRIVIDIANSHKIITNNYKIWLLRGILSSTHCKMFIQSDVKENFLFVAFEEITSLTAVVGNDHYHAFQALHLWWNHVLTLVKTNDVFLINNSKHFAVNGKYHVSSKALVWKHWDSPIPGVVDFVVCIFKCILMVFELLQPGDTAYYKHLTEELCALPAFIQGKYAPLSVLVAKMGAEAILISHPNLLIQMVDCLGINHLASIVSKLYKNIVISLNIDQKLTTDKWSCLISPSLIRALCHSDKLIQTNSLRFWLQINLSTFPQCFNVLQKSLFNESTRHDLDRDEKQRALQAYATTFYLAGKSHNINVKFDENIIKKCLSSFQDETRAKAFGIICCRNKVAEPINIDEVALLMQFLPMNMDCSSPTFRHDLVNYLHAFLLRLRDSAISRIKMENNCKNNEEKISHQKYQQLCYGFIKWMCAVCLDSLHMSSSYQRKTTAIDLYNVLLKSFVITNLNCEKKKGFIPDDVELFLKKFETCNGPLTSQKAQSILLELFQDVVPEIRMLSYKLLITYFIQTHLHIEFNTMFIESFLTNPKAQSSESGALYIKFYHKCFLSNIKIAAQTTKKHDQSFKKISNSDDLIQYLCENFKQSAQLLQEKTIQGCYDNPTHSWILSLAFCFENYIFLKTNVFSDVISEVIDLNEEITNYALISIFGASCNLFNLSERELESSDLNASADFEQITSRVNKLIIKDIDNAKASNVLLSTDHEVILACFWLILKRSGTLLSTIARYLINMQEESEDILKQINRIFNLLLNILASCRHRGVIESCFESFQEVASALLKSKRPDHNMLPKYTLKRIIAALQTEGGPELHGATITRRSAGIPLVIEGILVSETVKNESEIINNTIQELLAICQQTTENINSNVNDIPQVHALFVLKQLFKNTRLGATMLKHSSQTFVMCLKCMSSPLWVVRNGATYLFGNLVSRMLGQKHVETDHHTEFQNSITTNEFFSFYPQLFDVILQVVRSSVKELQNDKHKIQYGLHATLAMLSKLTYGSKDEDSLVYNTYCLAEHLIVLLECPVLPIRRLTGKVLMSILSQVKVLEIFQQLLKYIPNNEVIVKAESEPLNQNKIHGILMFTEIACSNTNTREEFLNILDSISWLATMEVKNNPLNASTYLRILLKLNYYNKGLWDKCFRMLNRILAGSCVWIYEISGSVYIDCLIKFLLNSTLESANKINILRACLQNTNKEIQTSALNWIRDNYSKDMLDTVDLWILCADVANDTMTNAALFDIIIQKHQDKSFNKVITQKLLHRLDNSTIHYVTTKGCLSLTCKSIKIRAILLKSKVSLANSSSLLLHPIKEFFEVILENTSHCKVSEPERLSAAVALEICAGDTVSYLKELNGASTITEEEQDVILEMMGKLFVATTSLLYDEQVEIQRHACTSVALITRNQCDIMYHNFAIKKFAWFLCENFNSTSSAMAKILLQNLFHPQTYVCESKLQLFKQEAFNLYEEPIRVCCNLFPYILKLMLSSKINLCEEFNALQLFYDWQKLQNFDKDENRYKVNLSKFVLLGSLISEYYSKNNVKLSGELKHLLVMDPIFNSQLPECVRIRHNRYENELLQSSTLQSIIYE